LLKDVGLGLEERLSAVVGTLSGGQRQALALVMAAMTRPKVLLLDEHIAALDPKTAQKVMEITHSLVVKERLTTLMITHNMAEAIRWGDRLIMMNEGRIIMDIWGEAKRTLTVADLTRKFHEVCNRELAVDRMLLSS
jgi:putative ABC transport system ATP-binding protein